MIHICETSSVSEPADENDANYMSTDSMQLRIYRNRYIQCSIKVLSDNPKMFSDKISLKKFKYLIEIYILH